MAKPAKLPGKGVEKGRPGKCRQRGTSWLAAWWPPVCGVAEGRRLPVSIDGCSPYLKVGCGLRAIESKKATGADPTHGHAAADRRAKTNITRKRQAREWDQQHSKLVDLSAFQRDILPLIQGVPLSQLQRATGLSLRYVSLIRRGERVPHPRHWQALLCAGDG